MSQPALPSGSKRLGNLPLVPLHGSHNAPLSSLLAWHAELLAADRECTTAEAAVEAAAYRFQVAHRQYLLLRGRAYDDDKSPQAAPGSDDPPSGGNGKRRGKGKARASQGDGDGDAEYEMEVEDAEDVMHGSRFDGDGRDGGMNLE